MTAPVVSGRDTDTSRLWRAFPPICVVAGPPNPAVSVCPAGVVAYGARRSTAGSGDTRHPMIRLCLVLPQAFVSRCCTRADLPTDGLLGDSDVHIIDGSGVGEVRLTQNAASAARSSSVWSNVISQLRTDVLTVTSSMRGPAGG